MRAKSTACILAAGIFWGVIGIFARRLNEAGLTAAETTQLRYAVSLAVAGLYLLLFGRQHFRIRLKDLWCFACNGILSVLMASFLYFSAMNYVSLSTAVILLYTAPIFVMLMSLVLFRERLTGVKLIALAASFAGCVLVSGVGGERFHPIGFLLGLGSGIAYALYSIFSRYAIRRGYSSWTITFYSFLFSTLGCCFLADWPCIVSVLGDNGSLWPWVLGMGLISGFFAYFLYSKGLEGMESSKASILASVEPVVGTLVGVLYFHEPMDLAEAVGILLVVAAVCILSVKNTSTG